MMHRFRAREPVTGVAGSAFPRTPTHLVGLLAEGWFGYQVADRWRARQSDVYGMLARVRRDPALREWRDDVLRATAGVPLPAPLAAHAASTTSVALVRGAVFVDCVGGRADPLEDPVSLHAEEYAEQPTVYAD